MDQPDRPAQSAGTGRGKFSPLVPILWAVVFLNLVLAHFAFGGYGRLAGGDAAGNAMSTAFDKLFMIGALILIGVLAALFLLIRRQGFRIAIIVMLGLNGFLLLTVLSLQF